MFAAKNLRPDFLAYFLSLCYARHCTYLEESHSCVRLPGLSLFQLLADAPSSHGVLSV
jgi:hypothetical protein